MHDLLNQARTSEMCIVEANKSVKLGLSKKKRNKIIKEQDIGNRLKPYFPDCEHFASFFDYRIDTYTVTNKMYIHHI